MVQELMVDDLNEYTNVINTRLFRRKFITSYSIILHTLIDGKIYYLLGRVRDTISFKEFVRGNIKAAMSPRYLCHISREEKYRILNEPFHDLIDDIIVNHSSKAYRSSYENEDEFKCNLEKWYDLLNDITIGIKEAPWIFPKGRKMEPETDLNCALREFEEETHIPKKLITIYDISPLDEIYSGLDGKLYKTVYYLGYIDYNDYTSACQDMAKQFDSYKI